MPPPPVPFFLGRTVSAREQPMKWSSPLLALQPRSGHTFTEPVATTALFVPPETLVSAVARRLDDPAWSALDIVGEMSRVDRPNAVSLAPLATEDADGLARALAARYALPRMPVDVPTAALLSLDARKYIRVEGTYAPYHCEMPNFEGLVLSARGVELQAGHRYRVVGFFEPGRSRSLDTPPPVGYSGACVKAISIEEAG